MKFRTRCMRLLGALVVLVGMLYGFSYVTVVHADSSTGLAAYSLVNGDYEESPQGNQIPGWGTYLGTSSSSVTLSSKAYSGTHSLDLTNGFISAWNVMNISSTQKDAPHIGDKVEGTVWVQVPKTSTDLSKPFYLWIDEVSSSGAKTRLAQTHIPSNLPRGKWVQITTSPVAGGIIDSSATKVVVSYQDYVSNGSILVDDLQVGYLGRGLTPPGSSGSSKPIVYHMNNSSFESGIQGWSTSTSGGKITVAKDGYYGKQSADIENANTGSMSSIWQTTQIGNNASQPHAGDTVESGAWIKLLSNATPAQGGTMRLQVQGVLSSGKKVPLAQSSDLSSLPKGEWTYVLTQPVAGQTVTSAMTGIVVSFQDSIKGGVEVDLLQSGQADSLTGEPNKFVIAEYQPWYGRPGDWHNWAWNGGGTSHNPNTVLPNGERDIASYYYPLVGAYDSTNKALLEYQVNTMKAMGVDCILVDWYANLQPDYVKTFNELVQIANQSDMKIAVFYEPKIHLANWIPSSSRQGQINGIIHDIENYVDQYANNKSILKVRGRPVVGVFGATDTGLTSTDWTNIMQTIHKQGYHPFMVGDIASNDPPSSFDGMMNWILYTSKLAADNSYNAVESFSEKINHVSAQWASQSPHRLGIGIVWPGFNDSGVDGWGAGSRVIPYSSNFYQATWDGMLKENLSWVVIATFNDFNESTAIEPTVQLGYDRVLATSKYIAQFKGTTSSVTAATFESIAREYDHTPPVIKIDSPKKTTYLDDTSLPIRATLTDAKSGVNSADTRITLDGRTVTSGETIALYKLPLGNHKISVSASDRVGNSSTKTRTFQITTSIKSLETLIPMFTKAGSIDNGGIENSLLHKLENNDLNSFMAEVHAQTGHHITRGIANILERDVKWLIQK